MSNINIRVSNEFELKLKREAQNHGMTLSEYCRKRLESNDAPTASEQKGKDIESMILGKKQEPIGDRLDSFGKQFVMLTNSFSSLSKAITEKFSNGNISADDITDIRQRTEHIWNWLSLMNQNLESMNKCYENEDKRLRQIERDLLQLSFFVKGFFALTEDGEDGVQSILEQMKREFSARNKTPSIFPESTIE